SLEAERVESPDTQINAPNEREVIQISEEVRIFQNINVEGTRGNYVITGEGRPLKEEFYYTVEDGHNEFVTETMVKTDQRYPNWSTFKIEVHIPEEKLPSNASLILHLYERSDKDSIIHSYPVLLETL